VWHFGTAGRIYFLQLTVWQFGTAGRIYSNLHCGSLVQRDEFTAAYGVAVWYSGTELLQRKMWQFVRAGLVYCSLKCGSLL